MKTRTIQAVHGILFVNDPQHDDYEVPELLENFPVASDPSCISICVQHTIDGPVAIEFRPRTEADNEPTTLPVVFRGTLETPSGRLVVTQADAKPIFSANTNSTETAITVRLNELRHASEVLIEY